MSGPISQLTADPVAGDASRLDAPGPKYQLLWLALARRQWSSVVLVPGGAGESAAAIATALADVGRRLRNAPLTAMVADQLDYPAAAQFTSRVASAGHGGSARTVAPNGRVIVAIPPVVTEPLGVSVALAADAVIVCVEEGRTRIESVRRTISLIGRERIAGCFLIR
jgi:hypothetical protein